MRYLFNFFAFFMVATIPVIAQQLQPTVLASAGNSSLSLNGSARLQFTLGETAIATLSSAAVSCGQGFHNSAKAISVDVADLDLAEWGLKVYPNPASQNVLVEYATTLPVASLELSLWDIAGRRLLSPFTLQNHATQRIDVGQLAKGVYLLRVVAPHG